MKIIVLKKNIFNLIKELENYTPFDQRENEDVKKTLEFLKNNQNCYDRSNLSGHVTAGAFVCDEIMLYVMIKINNKTKGEKSSYFSLLFYLK